MTTEKRDQPPSDLGRRMSWDAPLPTPRSRPCLRCTRKFLSAGPGERICPRCKATKAWRDGMPLSAAKAAETARRR